MKKTVYAMMLCASSIVFAQPNDRESYYVKTFHNEYLVSQGDGIGLGDESQRTAFKIEKRGDVFFLGLADGNFLSAFAKQESDLYSEGRVGLKPHAQECERFTFQETQDGKYYIRSVQWNTYLRANKSSGLLDQTNGAQEWELFELIKTENCALAKEEAISSFGVEDGLPSNDTSRIIITKDGKIVVGTLDGLGVYNQGEWVAHKDANGRRLRVTALGEALDGTLWVANSSAHAYGFNWIEYIDGEGIEKLTPEGLWESVPRGDVQGKLITQISFDGPQDSATVFSQSDVYTLRTGGEPGGVTFIAGKKRALEQKNVFASIVDASSNHWFGTDAGIYIFNPGETQPSATIMPSDWYVGYRNYDIRAMKMESSGKLWIGLVSAKIGGGLGGLVLFTPDIEKGLGKGTFKTFTKRDGLPSNHVRALAIDGQSNLWIATARGLTLRTSGENPTFKTFTTSDGLAGNDVRDVFFDAGRNCVWAATSNGITRLNLALLHRVH